MDTSGSNDHLIYLLTLYGHRELYLHALTAISRARAVIGKPNLEIFLEILKCKKTVIFLTIDDTFTFYCLSAFFRALCRRKTVGLSLQPVFQEKKKSLKTQIKIRLFNLVNFKNLRITLSILPFHLAPGVRAFCDMWIYDPAFWDLAVCRSNPQSIDKDFNRLFALPVGRKVILYLGSIDSRKGFEKFVELAALSKSADANIEFIAAGHRGLSVLEYDLKKFQLIGGNLIMRRLKESEVVHLQTKADFFWLLYHKAFDQSSGIAGRSFQLNKVAITREGSLASKIITSLGGRQIVAIDTDLQSLLARLQMTEVRSNAKSYSFGYKNCYRRSVKRLLKCIS